MTLPTGLLPALAFVLTVGVATLATLGAELLRRRGARPFGAALRTALLAVGVMYLAGVGVVWWVAGGGALWGLPGGLVAAGVGGFVGLGALPLAVGRELVRRARRVDPETALRFTTYGWPAAMLAVFAVFVAPGGLAGGHLLDLEGARTCLAGFCGVAVPLVAAVVLELVVAVFGPGLVGLALHASWGRTPGRGAGS